MSRPILWLTVTLPSTLSTWMLRSYRRPFGFLFGVVLTPLVVIMAFTYWLNVSLWRQQTLHNLGVSARLAAEIVQETLAETERFERQLASQPGFVEAVHRQDRTQITRALQDALPFIPRVDGALVSTPQGGILAASLDSLEVVGHRLADQESFRGAKRAGWQPYISAVYLREGPEFEKVVSVVHPIVRENTLIGLLQLQHRIEEIKTWLQKIRLEPHGFLYVVDHQAQLVVYPFQVLPGKPKVVSDWPPVAAPLPADGASFVFRDARSGQRWLAGIHPVGTTGWRVVAVQPEGQALRVVSQIFWSLGLLVVILMLVITSIGFRWAQVHALSLRLMRQNAKLLKQLHQRRIGESGKAPDRPERGAGP